MEQPSRIRALLEEYSDKFDCFIGSPAGVVLFVAWVIVMPFISTDVANYGISIWTAAALVVMKDKDRRERMAMQIKLDDLVIATDAVDDQHAGLEDRPEKEIKAARKGA